MNALCPLCGKPSARRRWVNNGTRYFDCEHCRVVFQYPQPQKERLTEIYGEDYYVKCNDAEHGVGYANYDLDMDPTLARSAFRPVQALHKGSGKRLLDIGCATGKVLEVARENGWEATGVELSPWAAKIARSKGFQVHTGMVENAQFPDQSFDAVTMIDVLEHVPDPGATLQEIRRILRPGGAVVVQTPNAYGFGARYLYRSRSMIVQPDAHLVLFSPAGLTRILQQAGFDVVHLSTHSLSDSFSSYLLTVFRRSVKGILKAMNFRLGKLDLTRWIKRKEMTELPQFSFNDVLRATAVRRD